MWSQWRSYGEKPLKHNRSKRVILTDLIVADVLHSISQLFLVAVEGNLKSKEVQL